jgi:hypothetical protein
MFGGILSSLAFRKRDEIRKTKEKLQSKSATSEDYLRAKTRKKRKKK